MTLFQVAAILLLCGLIVSEIVAIYHRDRGRWLWRGSRIAVWSTAMVGIAWPDVVTRLAHLIGIRRGADLVLYVSSLVFAYCGLALYSQSLALERRITALVRREAIREAIRGGEADERPVDWRDQPRQPAGG